MGGTKQGQDVVRWKVEGLPLAVAWNPGRRGLWKPFRPALGWDCGNGKGVGAFESQEEDCQEDNVMDWMGVWEQHVSRSSMMTAIANIT